MKCPKCEFENHQGARFCRQCGTSLEINCPNYQSPNSPDSKFCVECGHNLTLPAEPNPKDFSLDEKLEKIEEQSKTGYPFNRYPGAVG